MKKIKKIGGVIILAVLSAVMLCSCKQLDQSKHDHGIYLDDTKETVELRGKRYLLLNNDPDAVFGLDGKDGGVTLLSQGAYGIYITEKDVPVLLKNMYGDDLSFICGEEENPMILAIYDDDKDWTAQGGSYRYYCREDMAEAVEKAIKAANTDRYYLNHFYIEHYGWTGDGESYFHKILIDEAETDIIQKTLDRAYDPASDYKVESVQDVPDVDRMYMELRDCNEDMFLTKETVTHIIRTTGLKRKYYIACTPDYDFDEYGAVAGTEWKLVSEKDAEVMDRFFTEYKEELDEFYFDDYIYEYPEEEDSDF